MERLLSNSSDSDSLTTSCFEPSAAMHARSGVRRRWCCGRSSRPSGERTGTFDWSPAPSTPRRGGAARHANPKLWSGVLTPTVNAYRVPSGLGTTSCAVRPLAPAVGWVLIRSISSIGPRRLSALRRRRSIDRRSRSRGSRALPQHSTARQRRRLARITICSNVSRSRHDRLHHPARRQSASFAGAAGGYQVTAEDPPPAGWRHVPARASRPDTK